MAPRRPVPASHATAVPTLLALLAGGVVLSSGLSDAQAQTRPGHDAGVQPVDPPYPHPPHPPPPPPGGIRPVHPQPPHAQPQPPQPPQSPPDGGMARVQPHPLPQPPPRAVPGGAGKVGPVTE